MKNFFENFFSLLRFSDLAREKQMKAQKGKNLASAEMEGNKGLSLQERQLRDAAKYVNIHIYNNHLFSSFRMREKQQLAAQKKTGGNNDNNNASGGAGATASAR
jgi:hypothetical protein